MMVIHGSKPRLFSAPRQHGDSVVRVYGDQYEGVLLTVPDGHVLVVPEHGSGLDSLPEVKHEFNAGTTFRLVRSGDVHCPSITQVWAS